ncbi:Trypanosome variant surface glycoprotein (A-type) [Trypanosoma brucei equiperdum]|uniref:Trypanosome variant surface glycoprotein (A-type) n=1 Tax=Trypanosoma brucei equiperdum TaxID=630700 RepID=A0A3L6L0Y4_9TRYP|nr:Trypanosome variant surface glycoprotein (A-type) [Trypanosoma brucei equiperdum]RHW70273.1 Trypanosome variant surface glycoprotein (A-type) [Trypanosoma brucei equiperdum]RHW70561.1 Trypanosome variant surface glycoprotein (A-type) [Trypanosoma brucei equiperdum]RHW70648.1 Trypanosome variant surface glycoprotein (A-type) [Trypanosoma brucei equiperdum]
MTKVPAYVANRLQQLGREAAELQQLQQIMLTAVLPTDGAVDEEMATLLLLADKLGVDTARKIYSGSTTAVITAGQCAFYAGRLTEFVSIFTQAKDAGNHYCVERTTGPANNAQLTCLSDEQGAAPPIPSEFPAELNGVKSAYTAIASEATDLEAGGTEKGCGLTVHDSEGTAGYLIGQTTTHAIKWGNKMFTTANNKPGNNAHWQAHTSPNIDDSTYQECSKHLTAIVDQLKSAEQAKKLLLLLDSAHSTWQDLNIPAKSVAHKYPEKEIIVKAEKLKSIHDAIQKFKQNNAPASKTEQALAAATLSRIALNETACQLAATWTNKEGCQVTQAEAAKCEDKKQAECGTTKGCEWNKTEEKCKITEKPQKADVTKEDGKTTTNTTASNSFVIKKALFCLHFCFFNFPSFSSLLKLC